MANNPTPEVRSSVGSASEPGTPTPTGRAVMLGKEGAAGEKVIVAGGSTVEGFSETVTGPPTREHWKVGVKQRGVDAGNPDGEHRARGGSGAGTDEREDCQEGWGAGEGREEVE
ncbi:hypothetical protein BC936DRAFT_138904 [Jimgerdemannia flammicorona]|uniref:Uncharacterized protein n=1 Tax=Jimgerdemannia flammicorona TaxID=994334 RepID=A0A433BED0_9FUNG|nr:hypothetical protein BC936DRAFT_138904 [Jimgerdemannia flammicorona]